MPSPPEFRFGEGRISGVLSFALGALSVLAVLCFRFPALLTTPDVRAAVPVDALRVVLLVAILLAAVLGALSFALGGRRRLALGGVALAALAVVLGGAWVETPSSVPARRGLGLDWFVLNLLVLALVFVPVERLFARRPEQRIFRKGWRCDLAHFFASHLLVQVTVLLAMAPAAWALSGVVVAPLQASVRALPWAVQLVLAMLVADLFQYAGHRAFHAVPFLWRFHAVHHSPEELDWLAGSRLHLVDIVAIRALAFAPLFWLGFDPEPVAAYLVFASFQAVFNHANVRFEGRALRWLIATPAYHHWHHAKDADAVDVNFAAHLPVIDLVFGTAHAPGGFPRALGVLGEAPPPTWWGQLVWPFRRPRRAR
ncbi:MAG: sterol desaturase family protein [Myxococcales bacterium]|nr:sterol desaturase family protein [Myxococcales bacterium]